MAIEDEVLTFFRRELPEQATWAFKSIPLQPDDILQDYCDSDDIIYAINKFFDEFCLDPETMNLDNYFPWKTPYFFRKWFTQKPLVQSSKPLKVRMFAEAARAGRWLND
ncbi:DUF1493 family protein [Scandinavium goeteborgense]|uniref:DUF1493 family protein n=1 Tax=Scandinavium goeteborgense TaxID=1851514 RepID=UPI0037F86B90